MRALGSHTVLDDTEYRSTLTGASTDMGIYHIISLLFAIHLLTDVLGNITYAVPGFHGLFAIPTDGGVNHTPQFTQGAGSEEGFKRALDCAAGMAVVACRILIDDQFAEDVKRNFEAN